MLSTERVRGFVRTPTVLMAEILYIFGRNGGY
jgi:hypothetical protein